MTSATAAHEQPQFQADDGPSNLDRCNWCGEPRSAHGPDWSCPTKKSGRAPVIFLILGSLLAIAGVIMVAISTPVQKQTFGTLGTTCLLVGIAIDVAATILIRRNGRSQ